MQLIVSGVHFTVEGAFERCSRVLQFIQAACNEINEVRVVNQFVIGMDLPYLPSY